MKTVIIMFKYCITVKNTLNNDTNRANTIDYEQICTVALNLPKCETRY